MTETAETERSGIADEAMFELPELQSSILFAGAGAGKTRAVVEEMQRIRSSHGGQLRCQGRRVAVVTYTNAACDEISSRVDFDPFFVVSTIHSFAWESIRHHPREILGCLLSRLDGDLIELHAKQSKGRPGTKTAAERTLKLAAKNRRIEKLRTVKHFAYNPNGENSEKNSLNHAEVVGIFAELLSAKPLMSNLLIRAFPFLLIDESQDTQKALVEALMLVEQKHSKKFRLCLFGDMMQRIFVDGKVDLENSIPKHWARENITVNYRCPTRIVQLINQIRGEVDDHQQTAKEAATAGVARVFLVKTTPELSCIASEKSIVQQMATITSDQKWIDQSEVKTLTLEHHMAAGRGGFGSFFNPLYQVKRFRTGLLDGRLLGISFLINQVLPLVSAIKANNRFLISRVLKSYSPLLNVAGDKDGAEVLLAGITSANRGVAHLSKLLRDQNDPTIVDVLKVVASTELLGIPDVFDPILMIDEDLKAVDTTDDANPEIDAWNTALDSAFSVLAAYVEYISDRSPFGTHQGIKGLEFPRVMVVLNDDEARGFMFSFEKLLGVKDQTSADRRNLDEGKETSFERTRRLFYVTCSRAEESLAIACYTSDPKLAKQHLIDASWFKEEEIVIVS